MSGAPAEAETSAGKLRAKLETGDVKGLLLANGVDQNWIDQFLVSARDPLDVADRFLRAEEHPRRTRVIVNQIYSSLQKVPESIDSWTAHIRSKPPKPEANADQQTLRTHEKWLRHFQTLKDAVEASVDGLKTNLIMFDLASNSDLETNVAALAALRAESEASAAELAALTKRAGELVDVLQNAANSKHFSDVVNELRRERIIWLVATILTAGLALVLFLRGDAPTEETLLTWVVQHLPFAAVFGLFEWIAVTQFSQVTRQLREYRHRSAIALEMERQEMTKVGAERLRLLFGPIASQQGSDSPAEDLIGQTAQLVSTTRKGTD